MGCLPRPGVSYSYTNITAAVARATAIVRSQGGKRFVPRERLPRGGAALKK